MRQIALPVLFLGVALAAMAANAAAPARAPGADARPAFASVDDWTAPGPVVEASAVHYD